MKIRSVVVATALACSVHYAPVSADEGSAAVQANNPLANMTAFKMQNYYIGKLTEFNDDANQFWSRYAKPFSVADTSWLLRASLPINTLPTPPNGKKETWIGDLIIFAA